MSPDPSWRSTTTEICDKINCPIFVSFRLCSFPYQHKVPIVVIEIGRVCQELPFDPLPMQWLYITHRRSGATNWLRCPHFNSRHQPPRNTNATLKRQVLAQIPQNSPSLLPTTHNLNNDDKQSGRSPSNLT